jgi:hypothetical protein
MAVITFDTEKNSVCVLVEKSDLIHIKDDSVVEISSASKHTVGKVFVNGEIDTLVIRGERD